MGTGVGEAMLIGAVTGAGTSALTGNDPLKGALLGAAGGGIGAGVGGALAGGGSGATAGATSGATSGAATGTTAAVPSALETALAASNPAAGTIPLGSAGNVGMTTGGFGNTIGTSMAPTATAGAPSAFAGAPGAATATTPVPAPEMKFADIFKPSIPTGDGAQRDFGQRVGDYLVQNPVKTAMIGGGAANMLFHEPEGIPGEGPYSGPLSYFKYDPRKYRTAYAEGGLTGYKPQDEGIAALANNRYPQSQFQQSEYATPSQMPASAEVVAGYEPRVNPYTGQAMAKGGIADLGGYSDGGRLLKGPGDGMSDSIPAKIGQKQPARLADGEFVVPADVVSHLGNGSTDAGAKQLYAMMDKVRKARTGNEKQGKEINPRKMMPV